MREVWILILWLLVWIAWILFQQKDLLYCTQEKVPDWIYMVCELPKSLTDWYETKTFDLVVNEVLK